MELRDVAPDGGGRGVDHCLQVAQIARHRHTGLDDARRLQHAGHHLQHFAAAQLKQIDDVRGRRLHQRRRITLALSESRARFGIEAEQRFAGECAARVVEFAFVVDEVDRADKLAHRQRGEFFARENVVRVVRGAFRRFCASE